MFEVYSFASIFFIYLFFIIFFIHLFIYLFNLFLPKRIPVRGFLRLTCHGSAHTQAPGGAAFGCLCPPRSPARVIPLPADHPTGRASQILRGGIDSPVLLFFFLFYLFYFYFIFILFCFLFFILTHLPVGFHPGCGLWHAVYIIIIVGLITDVRFNSTLFL